MMKKMFVSKWLSYVIINVNVSYKINHINIIFKNLNLKTMEHKVDDYFK